VEVRNQRALLSGALFFVFAVFYLFLSKDYDPGTAARMGPGYFPRMLGYCLAGLGLFIMAGSLRRSADLEKIDPWNLKVLLWITGSIALFAFLLPRAGLVLSLAVLLTVAGRASREFTWRGSIISTVVLIAVAVGVFYYGIGLQFPLFPVGF
jgi:hypothetical protein